MNLGILVRGCRRTSVDRQSSVKKGALQTRFRKGQCDVTAPPCRVTEGKPARFNDSHALLALFSSLSLSLSLARAFLVLSILCVCNWRSRAFLVTDRRNASVAKFERAPRTSASVSASANASASASAERRRSVWSFSPRRAHSRQKRKRNDENANGSGRERQVVRQGSH